MLRYDDLSNDLGPLWSHQSCPDCIIATRGYDFREGQRWCRSFLTASSLQNQTSLESSWSTSAGLETPQVARTIRLARSGDWWTICIIIRQFHLFSWTTKGLLRATLLLVSRAHNPSIFLIGARRARITLSYGSSHSS